MKDKLLKLFKQNKGFLSAKQMQGTSLRYHLNKLIATKKVTKIRYGLYVLNSFPKYDEREIVATLVPNGVFCMQSAWSYHDLSTTIPYQYHIAVDRKSKLNLPEYPPIKLYYWSKELQELDIVKIAVNNKELSYYNLERSVCNAVKFRNKIGEDIMLEVLKNYIKRKDKNIGQLMQIAKKLRIEKVISPYLKILL